MNSRIYLSFISLILVSFLQTEISARKIVLDKESDSTRDFVHIDCYYSSHYEDFWAWGCGWSGLEPFPEDVQFNRGYWATCAQNCKIIFNTGIYPLPKSITLEGFVQGSSVIEVSGALSLLNSSVWTPIETIPSAPTWFSKTIDISGLEDIFVFSITPTASSDGFAVIDKLTFDLGDDVPEPPTTEPPLEETGLVILDTENQNSKYWFEATCIYSNHYDDFGSAWGCPTVIPKPDDSIPPTYGYWSSCYMESCQMQYYGSTLDPPLVLSLSVHMEAQSEIHIIGKRSRYDDSSMDRHLYTIAVPDKFCNKVENIDISGFQDVHGLKIHMVSARNSFVLVDKMSVGIKSGARDESVSSIEGDIPCQVTRIEMVQTTPSPPGGNSGFKTMPNFLPSALLFSSTILIKYLY